MTPEREIEIELNQSAYCLRMAAQLLRCHGSPEVATYLTEQADKNLALLSPLAKSPR
jgi:hypothetical protein